MNIREMCKFKVDLKLKKNCRLKPTEKDIVEIEIEKDAFPMFLPNFRMVNVKSEVFVLCDTGYIDKLETEGVAEDCGIIVL